MLLCFISIFILSLEASIVLETEDFIDASILSLDLAINNEGDKIFYSSAAGVSVWYKSALPVENLPNPGTPNYGKLMVWDRALDVLCVGSDDVLYIYKSSPPWVSVASYTLGHGYNAIDMHMGTIVVAEAGNAYIYLYTGSGIVYNSTISSATSGFGGTVAVNSGTVVIGSASTFGIYTYSSSKWTEIMNFTPTGAISSISMGKGIIAVGQLAKEITQTYRLINNVWTLNISISISAGNNNYFGSAVAVSTNGMVIHASAPFKAQSHAGISYTFLDSNNYVQHQLFEYPEKKRKLGSIDIVITSTGYAVADLYSEGNGASPNAAVYINWIGCSTNTTGYNCNVPNGCSNGQTYTGMWLSPTCLSCNPNYIGPLCNTKCSCNNGYCDDGIKGTGKCKSCFSPTGNFTGWFGENCSSNCTCLHGRCNDGISGTGLCLTCDYNYYGNNCIEKCTCNESQTCDYGIGGSNTCSNCPPRTYGTNCTNCTCTNGYCSEGYNGNGQCLECYADYYGPNCTECNCLKSNGVCDDKIMGNGDCSQCLGNWSGAYCNISRTCNFGIPLIGIDGNGKCSECLQDYWGENCGNTCTCKNGSCSDGLLGTGFCSSCYSNYYGENCDKQCLCSQGECDFGPTGSGYCLYCEPNYFLYDGTCSVCPENIDCNGISIPEIRNTTGQLNKTFYSSLRVFQSQLNMSDFTLVGSLESTGSQYNISNSLISGDATFYDSDIYLGSDSSFIVEGTLKMVGGISTLNNKSGIYVNQCGDISNTIFIVPDSSIYDISSDSSIIPIIYSNSSCTNIINVQLRISSSDCRKVAGSSPDSSRGLNFMIKYDSSSCNNNNNNWETQLELWLILTISLAAVLFLVIVFLIFVYCIPGNKKKFFPFRLKPPELHTNYHLQSPAKITY